jgi:hypothetical protein
MHDGPAPAEAIVQHGAHDGSHAPSPRHESHACTCLGACNASAGAVDLPAAPRVPTTIVSAPRTVAPTHAAQHPAVRREFALPFANGPPRIA